MHYRDEFDGPDIRGAIGSIFRALDRRERLGPRKPVWAVAIVGALVVFLASVLWYSYPRKADETGELAVPIIRADAGPYKVVPSDPGGMEIPHRESTVFDTLREAEGGTRRVENLLGDPEEPVARDKLFAGIKIEGREVMTTGGDPAVQPEDAPAQIAAASQVEPEAAPAPQAQPVLAAAVDEKPSETSEVAAAPAAAPQEEQKLAAAATPVPQAKPEKEVAEELSRTEPASGVETFESGAGWYIQLASLRSGDAAKAAWADLQKSLSVLKPLSHRVEKADLGARGIYYRLQAGPFAEAKARDICKAVEAQRPGGCLVIKN